MYSMQVPSPLTSSRMATAFEDPAVKIFREYLRIPSVHPDPDYGPCVEFFKKQAAAVGLPVSVYGSETKPVVVITWEGTKPELTSIVFNSHMDVVPVYPEKWTYPPFSGHKTEDGKIYGRGSQDMKILAIQYLAAVRKLKAEGFRPSRTIHLLHVPDEEIGGELGMGKFAETKEFKDLNIGLALDEGCSSFADYFIVYNDERTKLALKISCSGQAGHGSLLLEGTAGEKMRVVLDEMFNRRKVEERVIEGRDMLTSIGNATSINLTMVEGGVHDNVVPPCINLVFDIRLSVNEDPDTFTKWINNVCQKAGSGVSVEVLIRGIRNPPTPTDSSNPFWPAFKGVLDKLGEKIVIAACCGATDMIYIRKHGIPALGFSPIKKCPVLMHDNDEFVSEQEFLDGITIYEELMKALTAVP